MKTNSSRVVLNVSGEIFETLERTLRRYPETLLGDGNKRWFYYCTATKQYFFNRSRLCFGAILFFYQSRGILRCPPGIPLEVFEEECHFFQIPQDFIINLRSKEAILFDLDNDAHTIDSEGLTLRIKVWNILENPETSIAAKVFAMISIGMIFLSIIGSCLGTVESLKFASEESAENTWMIYELTLNTWFLAELLARLIFSPNRVAFFKSSLNWVDTLAILPFFIVLTISKERIWSMGFLRIMRFIRIVRLFRLSKHSKRLKVVGEIIKTSIGDFQLLMLCLALVIIFGGSLMFYIEEDGYDEHESEFTSIPQSLWWGIQTITTLGYGDIAPTTPPGKLLAAVFMAFGALTISLPVLSVVTKFMAMYARNIEGYV